MFKTFKKFLVSGCAMAFAACVFAATSSSYVQKGLVANWDGIDKGVAAGTYDGKTTVWKDLVGQYEINVTNALATAKGFTMRKTSNKVRCGWAAHTEVYKFLATSTQNYTVEVVASLDNGSNNKVLLKAPCNYSTVQANFFFGLYFWNNNNIPWICTRPSVDNKEKSCPGTGFANGTTNVYTIVYENRVRKAIYCNGVEQVIPDDAPTKIISSQSEPMYVGCNGFTASAITASMEGTFCALRFYNRQLDADEIAANVRVDRERYCGEVASVVEVSGTVDGVANNLGSVTPGYGKHDTPVGTSVSFTIADKMTDGYFMVSEALRATYVNATVKDGESGTPAVRTETAFAYTTVDPKTFVVWNFKDVECKLSFAAAAHGSVNKSSAWVAQGGVESVTATPDANYIFSCWTGDVDGIADVTEPTVTVTASAAKTLTATFKQGAYPGEKYPADYSFLQAGWNGDRTTNAIPSDVSSEAALEPRFRTTGLFYVGPFDPDRRPGLCIIVR